MEEPIRGLDNAAVLHWLQEKFDVDCRVVSPRPVLPLRRLPTWHHRREDAAFVPVFVPVSYVPKVGGWFNDYLMAKSVATILQEVIESYCPDVILCSWLFPDGCALARVHQEHNWDVPVVLITQGSDTHQYLSQKRRREKIINAINLPATHAVVCRSKDLGIRLVKAGGDASKMHTIYNGVDSKVFFAADRQTARKNVLAHSRDAFFADAPLGDPFCRILSDAGTPLLLFVGNLLPVKNPFFLLKSHALLNERRLACGLPAALLVLVGDGPMRPDLTQEVAAQANPETVLFTGRLPAERVAEWMRAADMLCICSHNEGFCNVILEAMQTRLPVVSTDVGGISERLQSGACGQLVPPGDLDAYTDALVRVIDQTDGAYPSDDLSLDWESTARQYFQVLTDSAPQFNSH